MGLRDHQGDGTSHLLHLDLGLDLDLDYLHVKASASHRTPPGADAHAASMEPGPPEEAEGQTTTTTAAVVVPTVVQAGMSFCGGSSSGIGSTPADSDESTDSESEQVSTKMRTSFPGLPTHRLAHPQLRRSPCLDLESASPPRDHSDSAPEEAEEEEENAPPTAPTANPMDALRAYQNKMEFALKLGYQEGLIRLVLSKLGPDALINDILGELVKLGSKTDVEQAGLSGNVSLGPGASLIGTPSTIQSRSSSMVPSSSTCSSAGSTTSSSGCGFSDSMESRQSDSPSQMDSLDDKDNLRPIVVDGSNVAMSHGNKEVFSCQGIQLAVDWFLDRGHRDITVFVPAWRKEQSRPDAPITDQEILRRLEKDKILVFTPSRRVQGRRVVCYDDRFIVKLAYESDGIIVSNDNYRDLANEKPEWKKFIDERLLMYSFVNDKFMPPDDPLGRHGPSLENFLRKRQIIPEHKKQPCPYGKKCTYGHKCKFYHPERGTQPQRAVADELRASAKICSAVATTTVASKASAESGLVKSHSMPTGGQRQPPCGTDAKRAQAKRQSDPSVRALSYSDVEERLTSRTSPNPRQMETAQAKGVALTLLPAPGGPPMGHTQEPGREYPQSHSLSHSAGLPHSLLPLSSSTSYPTCDSPEPSYTLVRSYSGLRITLPPRSPERRLLPDSLTSDCSSEGSASCGSSSTDSYGGVLGQGGGGGGAGSERSCMSSPDLLLDDTSTGGGGNLRCSHLHLGPLQHHPQPPPLPLSHPHPPSHSRHWGSAQYPSPLPVPHTPPQHRASQSHAFSHHHPHQYLQHQQQSLASYGYSFGYDERPDSPHFSTPARPYMSPQLQHQTIAARSSCPGECPSSAGSSPRPQSSPVGRRLASTRADSVSDSRLYESSPLLPRKALFSTQESLGGWESYYLQPPSVAPTGAPTPPLQQPQPCYEPMRLPGLLESREQVWRGSWSHRSGTHGHQAPPSHGHHHGHHPHSPATTHTPLGSHPPEPPLVSRHQEVRQKVFSNLCNIFPIELVRLVMGRYPQVTDAQQLAAAILAEKNQPGSY